jgi:glycosidase
VDPRYGTWADVEGLAGDARVMFDAVINHVSAGSRWFLSYLEGDPAYRDFFISLPPETDLSKVVRPRTNPLLTPFETSEGTAWVWTTFSADQIDLNYRSPELFLHVLGVLLDYAAPGASMIRLDAVQFLWKEVGASSINLPQGHQVIQLLRACLDQIYADVIIVTEANVPHLENVSYFGGGDREAQMIYQFPLPPLVLDALHTGDVELLATWLRALDSVPEGRTFLNFLSSHDGVGVRPVEGILPQSRVNDLVKLTRDGGGQVGVRTVGADTAPYELNTTWFSLMETGYGVSDAIDRHLASHAIMLALRGIPAIYALSLVGGRSDQAGFDQTGRARSLNRTRFATEQLAVDLADPASIASRVIHGLEKMLRWRSGTAAFHPDSPQTVLDTPRGVLGIERGTANVAARVYVNVTSEPVDVVWPGAGWVGNEVAPIGGAATITVGPWDSIWLRKDG